MVTAQVLQHISNVQGSRQAVTVRFLLRSPLLGDAEMTNTKQCKLPSEITEKEERGGVGDHQDLFVLAGELLGALLVGEIEGPEMHAPMTHRHPDKRSQMHRTGEAERPYVAAYVSDPQGFLDVGEVVDELQPHFVGQVQQPLMLFGCEAVGDEVSFSIVVLRFDPFRLHSPLRGMSQEEYSEAVDVLY